MTKKGENFFFLKKKKGFGYLDGEGGHGQEENSLKECSVYCLKCMG